MEYLMEWDTQAEKWVVSESSDGRKFKEIDRFEDVECAGAMLHGLNHRLGAAVLPAVEDTIDSAAVIHSNVGAAELQVKFDGASVRIRVQHDGDDEVTLTRSGFDRMLSTLQAMARLHFR